MKRIISVFILSVFVLLITAAPVLGAVTISPNVSSKFVGDENETTHVVVCLNFPSKKYSPIYEAIINVAQFEGSSNTIIAQHDFHVDAGTMYELSLHLPHGRYWFEQKTYTTVEGDWYGITGDPDREGAVYVTGEEMTVYINCFCYEIDEKKMDGHTDFRYEDLKMIYPAEPITPSVVYGVDQRKVGFWGIYGSYYRGETPGERSDLPEESSESEPVSEISINSDAVPDDYSREHNSVVSSETSTPSAQTSSETPIPAGRSIGNKVFSIIIVLVVISACVILIIVKKRRVG